MQWIFDLTTTNKSRRLKLKLNLSLVYVLFLSLLFKSEVVAAKDVNGMNLNKIMDERHYLLTDTIFYNQKGLHVIEKIDTFISLGMNIDIVNNGS